MASGSSSHSSEDEQTPSRRKGSSNRRGNRQHIDDLLVSLAADISNFERGSAREAAVSARAARLCQQRASATSSPQQGVGDTHGASTLSVALAWPELDLDGDEDHKDSDDAEDEDDFDAYGDVMDGVSKADMARPVAANDTAAMQSEDLIRNSEEARHARDFERSKLTEKDHPNQLPVMGCLSGMERDRLLKDHQAGSGSVKSKLGESDMHAAREDHRSGRGGKLSSVLRASGAEHQKDSDHSDNFALAASLLEVFAHDNTVMECNLRDYESALSAALREVVRLRSEALQLESVFGQVTHLQELLAREMHAHARLREENNGLLDKNQELMAVIKSVAEADNEDENEALINGLISENNMLRRLLFFSQASTVPSEESSRQMPASACSSPSRPLSLGGRRRTSSNSASSPSVQSSPSQPRPEFPIEEQLRAQQEQHDQHLQHLQSLHELQELRQVEQLHAQHDSEEHAPQQQMQSRPHAGVTLAGDAANDDCGGASSGGVRLEDDTVALASLRRGRVLHTSDSVAGRAREHQETSGLETALDDDDPSDVDSLAETAIFVGNASAEGESLDVSSPARSPRTIDDDSTDVGIRSAHARSYQPMPAVPDAGIGRRVSAPARLGAPVSPNASSLPVISPALVDVDEAALANSDAAVIRGVAPASSRTAVSASERLADEEPAVGRLEPSRAEGREAPGPSASSVLEAKFV